MKLSEKARAILHGLFSASKGRKEEREKNGGLKKWGCETPVET